MSQRSSPAPLLSTCSGGSPECPPQCVYGEQPCPLLSTCSAPPPSCTSLAGCASRCTACSSASRLQSRRSRHEAHPARGGGGGEMRRGGIRGGGKGGDEYACFLTVEMTENEHPHPAPLICSTHALRPEVTSCGPPTQSHTAHTNLRRASKPRLALDARQHRGRSVSARGVAAGAASMGCTAGGGSGGSAVLGLDGAQLLGRLVRVL